MRRLAPAVAVVVLSPFVVSAAAIPCSYDWQSPLGMGSRGPGVAALQAFLSVEATGYYGRLTTAAVSAFQASRGIEPIGIVGPQTRAALKIACSSSASSGSVLGISTTTAPAATVPLSISYAVQPAPTLAPASALYVPFTSFMLTAGDADVDVTKLVATRVGPAHDQALDYVSLLDEDGNEVTYGYLQADHAVTFRDSFTVPAGETHTYTVAGNMKSDLTDYEGQRAGFDISAIEASVPVSGVLPIHGTYQTFNESLPIGSATLIRSPEDPASGTTRVFGDTRGTFSGVRVTAGTNEDLRLTGMTWRQSGSVGAQDITDVQVCAGSACVPAEEDARDYSVGFSPAVLIPKGTSVDITISGRLLPSSANRTVQFDMTYSTDMVLRGTTYGYGIAPYPEGNTDVSGSHSAFLTTDGTTDGDALTPFYAGSTVNVTSGTAVYIGL